MFTQPDRGRGRGRKKQLPPVAEYARELGLPLFQPEDVNTEGLEILHGLDNIDLGLLIAYGQFLDPEVFRLPRHEMYNFHASLLPRWRGAAPIRHAIMAGDRETGISVFRLREGMDTGPVCVRIRRTIGDDQTYGELYEQLGEDNVEALDRLLEGLKDDRLECEPQVGEATYAPLVRSEDARLEWDRPAARIERKIRAFCPDPGAFTLLEGKRFKIYAADVVEQTDHPSPGTLVSVTSKRLWVATGEGVLSLEEVQLAGSRRMPVEAFLAGQSELREGIRLGEETG